MLTHHLLTMAELAEYVGRHPQLLRQYYAEGLLPEPQFRQRNEHLGRRASTTRRFTLHEAEAIKAIFASARYGTFARKRKAG
ncbi:MAG: hypothetical protein ACREQ5_05260 [Candidatus Dormibacteria bacterium]